MNYKEKIFEGLKKYYDEEELLYHVTEPEKGAPSMIAMIHEDMSEMGNDATAALFFIAGLDDDDPVPAPEDPEGYLENAPVLHMFNIFLRFGDVVSPERMGDLSMAFAHLNNYTPGGLFVLDIKEGSFGYKQTLFLNESIAVSDNVDNIDAMHSLAFMTCERFMDKILDLADERISLNEFIKWSDSQITPVS